MSDLSHFRRQKDDFFKRSPQSPIPDSGSFEGLSYYDEEESLRLDLPISDADGSEITIQTTDGQERVYRRAAIVSFELGGEARSLVLYETPHSEGYFLPFRDSTSGPETYGAGRYLDLEPAVDGHVTIDFNLAYHPYCAYDDRYSCPLPPPENWLQAPVRAGERLPD